MPKYSTLPDHDQISIYMDDNERKDVLGKPRYHPLEWLILFIVYTLWIISLPVTWWCSFKVIPQYERAIIYRLGRLQKSKGPGLIYTIPLVDKWKKIDMRMRAFSVPPQEVYTVDGGLLKIGSDVQYRITDPMASFNELQDLNHTLRVTAVTVLNSGLAGKKLAEVENEKNYLNAILQNNLNKSVCEWGIEIARFELTNSTVINKSKGESEDFVEQDPLQSVLSLFKGIGSSASPMSSMFGTGSLPPSQPAAKQLLMPSELFAMTKGALNEELVRKIDAVFQFEISGEDGGTWCLDLRNGEGYIGKGKAPTNPDVCIGMSSSDLQNMYYGKLSATNAYMSGRMRVEGDKKAAMRLEELIQAVKHQQMKA